MTEHPPIDATVGTAGVPRLTMTGLRKAFGPTVALDYVNLSVAPGEVHALVGENGAGKSTLMRVLAGALRPDAGDMRIDGQPYAPAGPLDARRHGVAMVHQELSLAPHLTVAENILLGDEPTTRWGLLHRRAMRSRAETVLAELGHADLRVDARTGALPVATQQMIEIARVLTQASCRVLVLDEPTSSLARGDVERLFTVIRALRARGISIVYISHVLEEVQQIADRYTVLRDGRTVGSGTTAGTSMTDIVRLMAGRQMNQLFPRSVRTPGEVVLELEDLAGVFKPVAASLALRRGEVLGIAGLVGAGRTEMLRAIFGLDSVRRGRIRVGVVIGPASPAVRLAQGVGLLSEDRKTEGLALSMSLTDNLTLSKLEGLGPGRFVRPSRQRAAAERWVTHLGIRCRDVGQPIWQLSGGNQQKVALARLLHHEADVLLLDEPTRGIDVGSKAQIYELIDQLATSGKAILFVSSYLPELLGVSDRIAVMCRGRLGAARPARELDEHALLMEATGQA
jgi:ribose transport system ATP-binding protein